MYDRIKIPKNIGILEFYFILMNQDSQKKEQKTIL